MSAHYAMCKYDDATGSYIPLEFRPITDKLKNDDPLYQEGFQAGAASRDAEVAELTTQRTAFKDAAEYNKRRAEDAERQRDDLLEALKLSFSALETCQIGDYSTGHVIHPSFDEQLVSEAYVKAESAIASATDQFRDATKMIGIPATANYPHGSLGEDVGAEGEEE